MLTSHHVYLCPCLYVGRVQLLCRGLVGIFLQEVHANGAEEIKNRKIINF